MAGSVLERIHQLDRFGSVLGLERLQSLLKRLGDPQDGMKFIHVAGTNGKGSVCKFLEGGLSACGYRVGMYISPYIEVFNERIQCGDQYISDEALDRIGNRVLDEMDAMVAEGEVSPTEFEAVMAIAFMYFAEQEPDIVVLETGLGGRGDATNVIRDPLACIITTVTFDHTDVLGDTLEKIAGEKAGIIKDGAPVISNVEDRGAAAVIARKAYGEGCRLYDISKIEYNIDWASPLGQQVSMDLWGTDYRDMEISMSGRHQAENLKTAIAALEVLRKERKIRVERSALYRGLKEAVWPGRFEVVGGRESWESGDSSEALIVLDGAHNEAGASALAETAGRLFQGKKILMVVGILADKDVDAILDHFTGIRADFIAASPDNPRRLSAEELGEKLSARGRKPVAAAEEPAECVRQALDRKGRYDVILFAGSLYLIGAVRRLIGDERG